MPDSFIPLQPPVPARDAFQALPLEQPAHSAWPAVATAARRRRARPRRVAAWTAAAAAALLLALWIPWLPQPASAPPGTPAGASAPALPAVDALVQQSQALEARLQADAPALRSGSAVLAARWIAADIAAIDVALAGPDPTQAAMLWQARVALLVELDGLRSSEAMAASGGAHLVLALD